MVMMIFMMAMMMMMFDHQFDQSDFETEYDNDDQFISDAVCGPTLNSTAQMCFHDFPVFATEVVESS